MKLSTPTIPFLAIPVLLLTLLTGCASKPTVPDWVVGDSNQYKSTQYLIGRGQGSSQEDARDRARADLSKIFQVTIAIDSEDVQKFKSDPSNENNYESHSSRRISTHTEQIIRGIQIAEHWQDPNTHSHYALAILPRLQTAASMRQQISQLDNDTSTHIEHSRQSTDLFVKIAAANLAIESQLERGSLQKSLQIVDITGRATQSPTSSAKLYSDMNALLKRVKIAPQVTGDAPAEFTEIISGALAKAGFMIDTGENPDFILKSKLTLTDLGVRDRWHWMRGNIELVLTETANNRVRGTKRWNIKGNAQDKAVTLKRTMNQADSVLKRELRTAVIEMATSH